MIIWVIYTLTFDVSNDLQENTNDEPQSASGPPQSSIKKNKKWYSKEFMAGLKETIWARLHIIIFMASRLAFVLLVVVFSFLPTIAKTAIF